MKLTHDRLPSPGGAEQVEHDLLRPLALQYLLDRGSQLSFVLNALDSLPLRRGRRGRPGTARWRRHPEQQVEIPCLDDLQIAVVTNLPDDAGRADPECVHVELQRPVGLRIEIPCRVVEHLTHAARWR